MGVGRGGDGEGDDDDEHDDCDDMDEFNDELSMLTDVLITIGFVLTFLHASTVSSSISVTFLGNFSLLLRLNVCDLALSNEDSRVPTADMTLSIQALKQYFYLCEIMK